MLEKTYTPADVEARLYDRWERSGAFAADVASNAAPYTIMMPPPNVTGSLHMGHALTMTVQDILIRYNRMAGRDALWQPGTDHAGIATQMVVERNLAAEGTDRRDLGREAFIEKVWQWKAESGGTIVNQLRRLGASPDWERERFTMDDGLSAKAVRKVFVELYKRRPDLPRQAAGQLGPAAAHGDLGPRGRAASEIGGQDVVHPKYPMPRAIRRPLRHRRHHAPGNHARRYRRIAVHPDDERYKPSGRQDRPSCRWSTAHIPIVADDYADPEKGSGAVKITPAHDFNDFEVGQRHNLETDQRARCRDART